ncbi:MAG: hypothetical protein NVS3B21_16980 [Acidimicrobiales bacterium]
MSHDLARLGPVGFQDLAAALAIATFGANVHPMGAGRDGGRDLYFKGPLVWQHREGTTPGEVWDGYTVFQVKHKAVLAARPADNASWLWAQVRSELEDWADPESERGQVPDYLVVITNVPLTPVPDTGGHDRLAAAVERYRADLADGSRDVDRAAGSRREARLARVTRIRQFRVWDGNKINALLTVHDGVRRGFPAFLTGPDVFAGLAELTGRLPMNDLEAGLRAHARTALTGEGAIYFDEAGSADGVSVPLHEVAIDLPVVGPVGTRRTVVGTVLGRAEHVLKPSLTIEPAPRHLIVTGAPGNGKTTVSKFLVQAFRATFLDGAPDLSADQRRTIEGTRAALVRLGQAFPLHRRWPVRIDLAEYAQEGGLAEDSTLLKWIAQKVSARSNLGDVSARALHTWMQQWPWLLVLDGLDEVTETTTRWRLIARVTEFVNDAEAEDCDALVVLTTRPTGYTENIAPTHFERIDLDYLDPDEAVRYGTLATRIRLRDDHERIDRVARQLTQAAGDDSLRPLLRTPLQVLILTIIVDGSGQLAPDRYSLFWGYYETVFRREKSKPGAMHRILTEHGHQVQQLHERVGFELQVRSEAGDRSLAALTEAELKRITWQVLHEAGYKPDHNDAGLLEGLHRAATQRLVLLAPRGDDGYGFDVRPLQELMAAMHVTTGPLDVVMDRLRLAAPSPHWRNTWVFAAGRLFATPQHHQHEAVVRIVTDLDQNADRRLAELVPIAPRLALDLIDDGMARSLPTWRDALVATGMQVLREPSPPDLPAITRILVRYANNGDDHRNLIAEHLRTALGSGPIEQETARLAQQLIPGIAEELHARPAVRGLAGVRRRTHSSASPPAAPTDPWTAFTDELATHPRNTDGALDRAAAAVRRIRARKPTPADIANIVAPLAHDDTAAAFAGALRELALAEPGLVARIRDDVMPAVHRQPIGWALGGGDRRDGVP